MNGTVLTRGTTSVLKVPRSEVVFEVNWCGEDVVGIWTKIELCVKYGVENCESCEVGVYIGEGVGAGLKGIIEGEEIWCN